MKKTLTLVLLSVALLLNACKKNKQEAEKAIPVKLLTRFWGTVNYINGSGLIEKNNIYTYDDQNRLIQIKDGLQVTDYVYKDDLLTKVTFAYGNGFIMVSEISYEKDRPITSKETLFSSPNEIESETVNNYIYGNDLVSEIQSLSKGVVNRVSKYTYQNKNINSVDNGSVIYTYKYDEKKNPYVNKYMKNLMLYPDFISVNNMVEITVDGDTFKSTSIYIYTYDDEGYPLTMKSPEGQIPIYDLHFEYVVK